MNVVVELNRKLECPACRANGCWKLVARPKPRLNSTIHGLRCVRCNERIAAKAPHSNDPGERGRRLVQREFRTLSMLKTAFVQDERYGTVSPVEWIDGIMVTRWFAGPDLQRYVRGLDDEAALDAYRGAGAWLRRLHDSRPEGYSVQTVNVGDKLDTLADRYGRMLHDGRDVQISWEALQRHADQAGRQAVRATWSHGDFKPENLLCDRRKYVGLDIHLQFDAPVVFDIASFLDHAWLNAQTLFPRVGRCDFQQLENAFLDGYGDLGEHGLVALHWAELYFALSYLGRDLERRTLQRWHAKWRTGRLVRTLADQLNEAA